jgi:hypothetical protein
MGMVTLVVCEVDGSTTSSSPTFLPPTDSPSALGNSTLLAYSTSKGKLLSVHFAATLVS